MIIGMFALTLVATSAFLIFISFRARALTRDYATQFSQATADLRALVTNVQSDLVKRVAEINGEDLKEAAQKIDAAVKLLVRGVRDNQKACLVMGEIYQKMFSNEDVAKTSLPPEAYAEPDAEGGKFVSQSEAARRDAGTLEDM